MRNFIRSLVYFKLKYSLPYFRLPSRSSCELCSSELLRSE